MRSLSLLLILFFNCLYSANAQAPYEASNIRVSCFDLHGLNKRILQIVDEQQLVNNDRETWQSKDNCSVDSPDLKFTIEEKEAKDAGGFGNSTRGLGFIGWLVTDKWLVPIEKVFFTKGRFAAYRPANIYSRAEFSLPTHCFKHSVERNGVQIVGHQFSVGNKIDDAKASLCIKPTIKTIK